MKLDTMADIDAKDLRYFGLILGSLLVLVFGLHMPWLLPWKVKPNWYWIATGGSVAAWSILHTSSFRVLYSLWMRISTLIGTVTNAIILAAVFYFLIAPLGVIIRLVRNDPLRRKFEPNLSTYRTVSKVIDRISFERMY